MVAVLVFAVFVFVWYFPAFKKQGKVGKPKNIVYWKAILLGFLPCTIMLLAFQIGFAHLFKLFDMSTVVYNLVDSFVSAALVEELCKFFFAWLIIRSLKPTRKIDYALIFGGVGLGYEICESLMGMGGSVVASIVRGVFAFHILWQFWMGLFYYEYVQAKQKGDKSRATKCLLSAFLVPIVIHGLNDFIAFMGEATLGAENMEGAAVWFLIMAVFLLLCVAYAVVTMKLVFKAVHESQQIDLDYNLMVAEGLNAELDALKAQDAAEAAARAEAEAAAAEQLIKDVAQAAADAKPEVAGFAEAAVAAVAEAAGAVPSQESDNAQIEESVVE